MDHRDDAVDHPQHYGGDTTYEAIKVIEAWGLGFCLGNAIKYICRAGKKVEASNPNTVSLAVQRRESTLADLKKARWYLDREIARLEQG